MTKLSQSLLCLPICSCNCNTGKKSIYIGKLLTTSVSSSDKPTGLRKLFALLVHKKISEQFAGFWNLVFLTISIDVFTLRVPVGLSTVHLLHPLSHPCKAGSNEIQCVIPSWPGALLPIYSTRRQSQSETKQHVSSCKNRLSIVVGTFIELVRKSFVSL